MNKPDTIFKYFTEERIDFLKNGLIRFTQPKEFNDPFEAFPYFLSMAPHNVIDEYAKNFDSDPKYYKQIFEETIKKDPRFKLAPHHMQNLIRNLSSEWLKIKQPEIASQVKSVFSSAMKFEGIYKPFMTETILNSINMSFGILCFTEKHDNLLMWSHYANSHKGFVLEFFSEHDFFDQRKTENQLAGHLKKVRYTTKRPEFIFYNDDSSQKQSMENWIQNFIWVKSAHWEYEQEWRILTILNKSEKTIESRGAPIHLFSFPQDAIKNIFLGCKMNDGKMLEFISLIKRQKSLNHINIFQAIQDEREYKLRFESLNK
jgi:hypothetical protein